VGVEVTQITQKIISWELLGGHIVHIVMNCITRLIQAQTKDRIGLGAAKLQFCSPCFSKRLSKKTFSSLLAASYVPGSNLKFFSEQQLRGSRTVIKIRIANPFLDLPAGWP
jgi:hypothetical protein